MATVKVFAYKDELGRNCEDFVVNDTLLYPLGERKSEEDRKAAAIRCVQGRFLSVSAEDNMNENAVLIATYNLEDLY